MHPITPQQLRIQMNGVMASIILPHFPLQMLLLMMLTAISMMYMYMLRQILARQQVRSAMEYSAHPMFLAHGWHIALLH